MKKLSLILILSILMANMVFAGSITMTSVDSIPSKVEPGSQTGINVYLRNQGSANIKDVKVSLDLSSTSLPFIPLGSAAQKTIDEIDNDKSKSVSFTLLTNPDARPGTYKIPIILEYKENDENIKENSVIGIIIESTPVLDVAIEESEIYKVGQTGQITVRFVNKGLSDIKFLSAELPRSSLYDVISANSVYIGNVEPDDFETASFEVRFKQKATSIPLEVEYKDDKNVDFKKSYNLDINLFTQKEAIDLGLEQKPSYFYFIGIIIVVVIFFLYRRHRKKRQKLWDQTIFI